ncbi:MAG: PDZ domain-containing protein [Anaerolineales bacterium]|nr:PDZ domain-containing protein [Anaerolineales bacterium]
MIKHSRRFLIFLVAVFSILLSACSGLKAEPTTTPTPEPVLVPTQNHHLETFDALWETIETHYIYGEVLAGELQALKDQYKIQVLSMISGEDFSALIHEMLTNFPGNTASWQSREERLALDLSSEDISYQGIGAFVSFREQPEPHIVLVEVMNGSPAETAGLRDRDSIYAIDGLPFTAGEGFNTVQRVRGPAGSDVALTVQSPGKDQRIVVVTRGSVVPQSKKISMDFIDSTSVVYAEFPRITYGDMAFDFFATFQAFSETQAIEGLIIDLRVSSGSSWPLVQLLSMFTDGQVGMTMSRTGGFPANVVAEDYFNSQNIPVVILIGPDTWGQSEIFAAAMQISNRATVMGLPTLGLIEGSESFPLPDGSVLSIATTTFVPADQRQIGILGVQPDIVIEALWETQEPGNDLVVDAALKYLLDQ